jgi:hypothetical protein
LEPLFPRFVGIASLSKENAMTGLKLLGAAAILFNALAGSAVAQEATQEPGALGQNHPFVDYLTGGFTACMAPRAGNTEAMTATMA